MTMFHQTGNINKQKLFFKRNQIKNLELKTTIIEMQKSLEGPYKTEARDQSPKKDWTTETEVRMMGLKKEEGDMSQRFR